MHFPVIQGPPVAFTAPILLTLLGASATVACLVWWLVSLLPLKPVPEPPPRAMTPLEQWLERELDLKRTGLPVRLFLPLTLAAAAVGVLLAMPFQNGLLTVIGAGVAGAAPYQYLRTRIRSRSRAIHTAIETALVQIAQIADVRHHPFLALSDAVPMLEPPLRDEFTRALLESQAGTSLPDALRSMASRCYDNFYLHQLAELVAINIRDGGDLAGSLRRLAGRLRTMEELRAEEAAELFGYHWLTRLLFGATLLPLPYWVLTRSSSLKVFVGQPLPRLGLVWVVVSGLVIVSLPYWLAIED